MTPLTLALLGLGTQTGCVFGTSPLEGVWIFFVSADYTVNSDSDCSENYNDASCPGGSSGGESPWTYTYETEQDTDTFVAQIVGLGGGQAAMFVNDLILTGEKGDGGNWVFTYENFVNSDSTEQHEDGYSLTETADETETLRFRLDRAGGTFTGTMEVISSAERTWTETDVWSADDVGIYDTQVPASTYLVHDDNGFVDNDYEEADCANGECELSISGTTQVIVDVTAERTDINQEGDLDALEDDGDYDWDLGGGLVSGS
ncbi:MAG: hypothetical protein VX899_22515 [Myxococcota bacterium]|nr:hypothetical protein [Myxococcota bacterium]